MKINSFKAEGVHDYLRFDITFYPDLTFLIGINGSGKTSALKLILGLTSPAFQHLNSINYKYCEVICSSISDERDIVIKAEQTKETFTLQLTYKGSVITSGPIKRFTRGEEMPYDTDEIISIEQRHKEGFDAQEVARKIRELATPKFLGLDRRIYEGSNIQSRFRSKRGFFQPKYRSRNEGYPEPQAIDISLEEVQSLIFDYTRRLPEQQYQINDEFKQKLFNQSFNFIEQHDIEDIAPSGSFKEKKEKVLKAIDDLGIRGLNYYINNFFTKMENVALEYEHFDHDQKDGDGQVTFKKLDVLSKWYRNGTQLKRIDDIIRYSQEYQSKVADLRAPFKKLESLTMNFLKEGKKKLKIEADGEIKVVVTGAQSSNIYGLSSGEKQIIIMIAHLIFEEAQKASGVFIIDEPELSLHIAWQEIFVQSIMEASPNTQFILATHSPSIIAKVDRERYCQDLNKLNY
jgi:predicted ATP-binding protein involved in virulence